MDLSSLLTIVKDAAPLLGGMLSSPVGEIASIAFKLISAEFGGNHATSDELLTSIQSATDASLRLKLVEEQNKPQIEEILSKNIAIAADDRKDARKITTLKISMFLLFFVIAVLFFSLLGTYISHDSVIDKVLSALAISMGALLAFLVRKIIEFYYGA